MLALFKVLLKYMIFIRQMPHNLRETCKATVHNGSRSATDKRLMIPCLQSNPVSQATRYPPFSRGFS